MTPLRPSKPSKAKPLPANLPPQPTPEQRLELAKLNKWDRAKWMRDFLSQPAAPNLH